MAAGREGAETSAARTPEGDVSLKLSELNIHLKDRRKDC